MAGGPGGGAALRGSSSIGRRCGSPGSSRISWICPASSPAANSTSASACDVLVREEGSRFEEAAIAAGLTIDVDAARVPAVRGSGRDLSLLVRNLLDNAIRYTGSSGTVVASVSADNGSVVLRVTDTGSGIPSKELPRVFERFYRVDRARSRETGGTGLGLAIVRHVAENHGGTVTVTSELGRGSAFEVRLPSAVARGNRARLRRWPRRMLPGR